MGDYTDLDELECPLVARVIPSRYRLSIFDIQSQIPWLYSGEVDIRANITSPSDTINIHADSLDIQAAVVHLQNGSTLKANHIHILEEKQIASLHFPSVLPCGNISLAINFQGQIDESMRGFYRTRYQASFADTNVKCSDEHMLVTQFEPCSARKAFPCFDEPYLKASFELVIETAEHLSVLSNMPYSSEETVIKDSITMKRTTFEASPIMSTYLLAWAIGDFEYVEAYTERKHLGKQVPVRLYATPGLVQHGQFALHYACKVLDYFADVFGIDYPLPKSDHLIAHDFIGGAMENWGLIVYKPTKILFELGACDNRVKNKAAYVIAHEIAHQWFGNLVTLSDWDELWLNEGFATWAGYLAMDHILPDWRAWEQFNVEVMEEAFNLDGLRSTHPIKNRIDDPLAASQAFDSISYFKGASVIRMLCNYLGSNTFFRGVQTYLKRHKYRNATSQNLWDALADASGFDVANFMDSWLHEPGYPVVKAEKCGTGYKISQTPWTSPDDGLQPITWNIPLTGDVLGTLLPTMKDQVNMDAKSLMINDGHTGFYRVAYPSAQQEAIFAAKMPTGSKAGLIADIFAQSYANKKPISEFLACARHVSDEIDTFLWQQISASFSTIRSVFATDNEISHGLRVYLTDLTATIIERVDWQVESGQYLEVELKKIILNFTESFDHPAVVAEAQNRFDAWRDQGIALDGNLLLLVFSSVLAHSDDEKVATEAYKKVLQCYREMRAVGGKELCLRALGRVCAPDLIVELAKLSISPDVSLQDAPVLAAALGRNPVARPIVWQFMKSHWTEIESALSSNDRALSPWVQESLSSFSELECLEDINKFFEHKNVPMLAKGLNIVREMVTKNALFKMHQEDGLRQWLRTNGYLG